ncbi:hypothetical protein BHW_0900078 [Borrelia hermsii MTW]|nr:hypothetical protein BHW_0900078 [Borrelia hermsii MTW]
MDCEECIKGNKLYGRAKGKRDIWCFYFNWETKGSYFISFNRF